jgi:hypothetical protein
MSNHPDREQKLTIRPGPLFSGLAVALVVCMAAVGGVAQLTEDPRANALAAIGGLAVTGALFAAGTVVIASGKPRPASLVGTLWLASTIVRVMGLGLAGISIYFAAPSVLLPAAAGAGGAYLVCLVVETAMVARQALKDSQSAS